MSPPLPHCSHVPGMNWAIPFAPALLVASGIQLDSCSIWAARIAGEIPESAAACSTASRYSAGICSSPLASAVQAEPAAEPESFWLGSRAIATPSPTVSAMLAAMPTSPAAPNPVPRIDRSHALDDRRRGPQIGLTGLRLQQLPDDVVALLQRRVPRDIDDRAHARGEHVVDAIAAGLGGVAGSGEHDDRVGDLLVAGGLADGVERG